MGLFDWFKKPSNVEVASDRIWLTREAKASGIRAVVEDALQDPDGPIAVLLVAHFADWAQELRRLVEDGGLDERRVMVVMADDFQTHSPPVDEADRSRWVLVVVAERHPLSSHDESLVEFAESISCRVRVEHHLSLDDPLMHLLARDWVKNTLVRLGMSENQAIESRMITRRIQQEQKKMALRVTGDLPAESADEWIDLNGARDI